MYSHTNPTKIPKPSGGLNLIFYRDFNIGSNDIEKVTIKLIYTKEVAEKRILYG